MKLVLAGFLALSSLSAFAIGGSVEAGGKGELDICALSDGNYCYNSAEMTPSGTSICSTWTPPSCSQGSTMGTVKKKFQKLAPMKKAP
jgi:hypothetical protein